MADDLCEVENWYLLFLDLKLLLSQELRVDLCQVVNLSQLLLLLDLKRQELV